MELYLCVEDQILLLDSSGLCRTFSSHSWMANAIWPHLTMMGRQMYPTTAYFDLCIYQQEHGCSSDTQDKQQ